MEVCWGRAYISFIPICASYFVALIINSNSCRHCDHPRPFPEGSCCGTAELSKQGRRGWKSPWEHRTHGMVSTSQGRRVQTASQPKVKARYGSGKKPRLSRKGAGMCSNKSPSLRSAFWDAIEADTWPDAFWASTPFLIFCSHFSDLLQISQMRFYLFTSLLSAFIQLFVVMKTLRSISMWESWLLFSSFTLLRVAYESLSVLLNYLLRFLIVQPGFSPVFHKQVCVTQVGFFFKVETGVVICKYALVEKELKIQSKRLCFPSFSHGSWPLLFSTSSI